MFLCEYEITVAFVFELTYSLSLYQFVVLVEAVSPK